MTRKTPLDKIIEATCQRVTDELQYRHDDSGTESPIEAILLTALISGVKFPGLEYPHCFGGVFLRGDYSDDAWLVQPSSDDLYLFAEVQATILQYRADIVLHAPTQAGYEKLVIECDGHDFHERTKEQAARDRVRDRAMQEVGYTVFRFTGSEIYRDPCKCAAQIIAWAQKATFK